MLVEDEPPLLTLLDLWYTAFEERPVYFTWESLEDNVFDDWLMQNMALVVHRFVRGEYAGQRILREAPYKISVRLDVRTHRVRVVVFMENEDGNS